MPTFTVTKLPKNLEFPIGADDLTAAAKDGVYIAVGSGVLTAQRIQVARRDLQSRIGELDVEFAPTDWAHSAVSAGRTRFDDVRDQFGRLGDVPAVHAIDEQFQSIEDRVDTLLDAVESKLPTPAQFMLNTVREVAKDSTAQARDMLGLTD
jgi:hypothetical protein